jgi:hypothetical protein
MRSFSDDERISRARAADIACRVGAKLKRVTSTEWAVPCPACGGVDRFSINMKRRVFNCRGFGGGDVIAMVEHVLGLNSVAWSSSSRAKSAMASAASAAAGARRL